jgi:hypothetical protein
MNAETCRVATEYASYVIFRENDGYNIFSSVIYDGLTARAGVAKVYWEEKFNTAKRRSTACPTTTPTGSRPRTTLTSSTLHETAPDGSSTAAP